MCLMHMCSLSLLTLLMSLERRKIWNRSPITQRLPLWRINYAQKTKYESCLNCSPSRIECKCLVVYRVAAPYRVWQCHDYPKGGCDRICDNAHRRVYARPDVSTL